MTRAEYNALKKGDKIRHTIINEISVIDSEKTQYGYFHKPEYSNMGWNTINDKTYPLYELLKPMHYTIIKNSESKTGYVIPDCEYKGLFANIICGWQFEYTDINGNIYYDSVDWDYRHPDEVGNTDFFLYNCGRMRIKPTGRVVFRGYGEEHWDEEMRDWYITDVRL